MNKYNKILALAVAIALFTPLSSVRAAKEQGKGHAAQKQATVQEDRRDDNRTDAIIDRVFTTVERAMIAEYFSAQWETAHSTGTLPPGLAKRDTLPPGLQKQLVRNGKLPPGLAKRDLPNDLLKRLGTPPKGTQRYMVGADIILVDLATNVLLDTIKGALYPPRSAIKWND